MKKLYNLFVISFLLFFSCVVHAQPTSASRMEHIQTVSKNWLPDDIEKFFLFESNIQVQPDGSIQVTEYIVVNALWQQIQRGIYRDIPTSLTEQITPVSLSMDGQPHPFFTERKANRLRINFGNNDYIPKGVHAYSFTYNYIGAIDFLKDYDELYWNVTGNEWNFPIERARVRISFPSNVDIRKDGISVYTGRTNEKGKNARQIGPTTFETIRPLQPQEGLTIAIPFEKGVIQKPSWTQRLDTVFSFPMILSLVIFCFLVGYFISTWTQVGRDPKYMAITQYEPPQGISPAFMYYLLNEQVSSDLLATAILDLAMKNHVEITKTKGIFSKTQLVLKKMDTDNLSYEEKELLRILFSASSTLTLDRSAASKFDRLRKSIAAFFKRHSKQYIISNSSYLIKAVILTLLLGVLPFIVLNPPMIFINLHFSVFFLVFTMLINKISTKLIFGTIFTLFYGMFWIAMVSEGGGMDALICQLIFLISMWGLTFYATLIRNVTPQGQALFESIEGFKKYMNTAEVHRVAASDPTMAELVFCDFLPFAFALGMTNKWIKKFSNVLDKTTIEKCTASVGGVHFISSGLSSCISSASPSGGSGSHGGGHSGGGHGGGGGGGR